MYRTNTCGELTVKNIGQEVTLSGWVHKRRDLGGLIFVDLRDRYGLTQVVFNPDKGESYKIAESLKYEYVVKVTGKVAQRDAKAVNKNLATGEIELVAEKLEILSKAKPLPFEIFDARKEEEDEDLRLKYRYLELRRERLKNNILFRVKMISALRQWMESQGFLEITTPILTVSSPEGARDFLVPSRLHPGKFYALPQAPQQYKQLLMVAGFDRYFQVAPCMRDEDPRADRSPGEFYQLDVETSFLESTEFHKLMEPMFVELTEKIAGKKVWQTPFPKIPYRTSMETYGTDRPDLRFGLEIQNVTEWAKTTEFKVFKEAEFVRLIVVPEGAKFSRKEIDEELGGVAKQNKSKGLAWLKFVGGKIEGGIAKFIGEEKFAELANVHKIGDNSLVLFIADNSEVTCKALGAVRTYLGEKLNLADPNVIAWAWIIDFPFYEFNEEKEKNIGNGVDFCHNPFSMPAGGLESLQKMNPLDIKADQYDIIANGLELASGAVRNKDPEVLYKAFEVVGYGRDVVHKKFGHMVEAFEYGAPPHCGFAVGVDRLIMLLTGEKNIRAIIPFPKNQRAEEPMMGSPSEVDERQLKELGIKLAGIK